MTARLDVAAVHARLARAAVAEVVVEVDVMGAVLGGLEIFRHFHADTAHVGRTANLDGDG